MMRPPPQRDLQSIAARCDGQAAPAQRATFEFKNNKRSFECFPAAYLYLEANGAAGWAFPVP